MIHNPRWMTRTRERMAAKPPEIAERLLLCLLPEQVRDTVSGDLLEIFGAVIAPSCGIYRARLWYWRQVICWIPIFLRFRRRPQAALEFWKGRIVMDMPQNREGSYHPGIRMHRIPVEGAIGLLFVFATVFIFGVGIPAVRGLLVITGTLGILGSGLLLYWHKRHALKIQPLDLHNSGSQGWGADRRKAGSQFPK